MNYLPVDLTTQRRQRIDFCYGKVDPIARPALEVGYSFDFTNHIRVGTWVYTQHIHVMRRSSLEVSESQRCTANESYTDRITLLSQTRDEFAQAVDEVFSSQRIGH